MTARWTMGMAALVIATPVSAHPQAQQQVAVPGAPGVQMTVIPVPAGANVDAVLPQVIEKVGAGQGGIAQHAKPTQISVGGTPMRVETVSFNKAPTVAFFFLSIPQGKGVCMAAMPMAQAGAAAKATANACLAAIGTAAPDGGGAPPAASAPAPAPAPISALAPAAHQANWGRVAGVYFRSVAGVGVGGMFIMDFEPLILFKDGSYYEIDDAALEDIDLAAERASRPVRWGKWTQQGDRFVLTGSKGRANDYQLQQGNFFKAFPAEGPAALSGAYKTVGGGGNTALGGEVMIAISNTYNFQPGGVFTNDRSTGAMNNGSMSGVGSTVAARGNRGGRYAVDRFTLTITGKDGRPQRRFFAFGSQKTPARIDKDMLFIGDTVYTLDD